MWSLGDPTVWLLYVFLTYPHYSLSISLLFGTVKQSRLSLDLPNPSPGISHFFKEFWIFLMESDFYGRNQDLGTVYSHCLLRSRHFQDFLRIEEGNIDMYIYTHLYFYIYLYQDAWVYIHLSNSNPITTVHCTLYPFHISKIPSNSERNQLSLLSTD